MSYLCVCKNSDGSICHTFGCQKLSHRSISRYLELPKFLINIEDSKQFYLRGLLVLNTYSQLENNDRNDTISPSFIIDLTYKYLTIKDISCRKLLFVVLLEMCDLFNKKTNFKYTEKNKKYLNDYVLANVLYTSQDLMFQEYVTENYIPNKIFFSKKRNLRRKLKILLISFIFKTYLESLYFQTLHERYKPFGSGYYEALEHYNSYN